MRKQAHDVHSLTQRVDLRLRQVWGLREFLHNHCLLALVSGLSRALELAQMHAEGPGICDMLLQSQARRLGDHWEQEKPDKQRVVESNGTRLVPRVVLLACEVRHEVVCRVLHDDPESSRGLMQHLMHVL